MAGDSAKGLRVVGKQSKPIDGDLQVSGLSLGACAGLDRLRKEAGPLRLRVRRGIVVLKQQVVSMGVAGISAQGSELGCALLHTSLDLSTLQNHLGTC